VPTPPLTAQEVCRALRISRWTLDRMIQRGELVPLSYSRRRLFARADVARLLGEPASPFPVPTA
jgi:excisionase family DNA binding protein